MCETSNSLKDVYVQIVRPTPGEHFGDGECLQMHVAIECLVGSKTFPAPYFPFPFPAPLLQCLLPGPIGLVTVHVTAHGFLFPEDLKGIAIEIAVSSPPSTSSPFPVPWPCNPPPRTSLSSQLLIVRTAPLHPAVTGAARHTRCSLSSSCGASSQHWTGRRTTFNVGLCAAPVRAPLAPIRICIPLRTCASCPSLCPSLCSSHVSSTHMSEPRMGWVCASLAGMGRRFKAFDSSLRFPRDNRLGVRALTLLSSHGRGF
jgi:hypothetical protein